MENKLTVRVVPRNNRFVGLVYLGGECVGEGLARDTKGEARKAAKAAAEEMGLVNL